MGVFHAVARKDPAEVAVPRGAGRRLTARDAEWASFAARLEEALASLEVGHALILVSRAVPYYVQVVVADGGRVHAEAVSNRFLDPWARLDATAQRRLRRLGWLPPVEIGDAPVNWWRHFDTPVPVAEVAELAVATLRKAFDIPRPAMLQYHAWVLGGGEILLPGLRLARVATDVPPLTERVDAALRQWLDVPQIQHDEDGDVSVRCDEATIFVRSHPQEGMVSVFSPVLWDVDRSNELMSVVNEVNATIRLARAAFDDRLVAVAAEVDAGPDMSSALIRACEAVSEIANRWAPRLQARFGGATCFAASPAPPGASPSPYL